MANFYKFTATEGVHDAMGKVIGINSGIVGAAGVVETAPAVTAAGSSLIRQGAKAAKAVGDKVKPIVKNPKVHKSLNAAGDFVNSALPTGTPVPSKVGYAGGVYGRFFDVEDQVTEGEKWLERKLK
ncbi:MAG: hypothetical protein JEY79_02535 [Pseudodesulfovibrio sp.]|nr:hypothetical protein [Pseudodesulfovibrio sp.]